MWRLHRGRWWSAVGLSAALVVLALCLWVDPEGEPLHTVRPLATEPADPGPDESLRMVDPATPKTPAILVEPGGGTRRVAVVDPWGAAIPHARLVCREGSELSSDATRSHAHDGSCEVDATALGWPSATRRVAELHHDSGTARLVLGRSVSHWGLLSDAHGSPVAGEDLRFVTPAEDGVEFVSVVTSQGGRFPLPGPGRMLQGFQLMGRRPVEGSAQAVRRYTGVTVESLDPLLLTTREIPVLELRLLFAGRALEEGRTAQVRSVGRRRGLPIGAWDLRQFTTDHEGSLRIPMDASATYDMQVLCDGRYGAITLAVDLEDLPRRLDVELAPSSPVAGVVHDADGLPVSGAWVSLMVDGSRCLYDWPLHGMVVDHAAASTPEPPRPSILTTAADGTFSLAGLGDLLVHHPAYAPVLVPWDEIEEPMVVTLTDGAVIRGSIMGCGQAEEVRLESGRPASCVAEVPRHVTPVAADGTFVFTAAPVGGARLEVIGANGEVLAVRSVEALRGQLVRVDIDCDRAPFVVLRLEGAATERVQMLGLFPRAGSSHTTTWLERKQGARWEGPLTWTGGSRVVSAIPGAGNQVIAEIEVLPGRQEYRVALPSGGLHVTIVGDQSLAPVDIEARALRDGKEVRLASVRGRAEARFEPLMPGDYVVLGRATQGAHEGGVVARADVAVGHALEHVDLSLGKGLELVEVLVRQPDGAPAVGAVVHAFSGAAKWDVASTGSTGWCSMYAPSDRAFTLYAYQHDYPWGMVTAEAAAGRSPVILDLEAGTAVEFELVSDGAVGDVDIGLCEPTSDVPVTVLRTFATGRAGPAWLRAGPWVAHVATESGTHRIAFEVHDRAEQVVQLVLEEFR